MAAVYSVEITIAATAYIKANSEKEAEDIAKAALCNAVLELPEGEFNEVEISGKRFSNPELPDVSLSPAMTICDGEFHAECCEELP